MPESSRLHRGATRRIGQVIHRIWPGEIRDVVFVVGCPRSGTSVFGRILSHHPRLLYMHEPRYIWREVNPRLNIWRGHPAHGRLYRDASQVNAEERQRLARWFHLALTLSFRQRLVEKTPLNVFRLRWLAASFPEARFVHIIRHPRDVAISLLAAVERWFSAERGYEPGHWASSWHYLMFEEYADTRADLQPKVKLVQAYDDDYARALLVWLCSVWEGREAGRDLGPGRYLTIRYENLVSDPDATLQCVSEFLGERLEPTTLGYARRVLHARSVQKPDPNPGATRAIAGDLLTELGYEA